MHGRIEYNQSEPVGVFRAHNTDYTTREQRDNLSLLANSLDLFVCWYYWGQKVIDLHRLNPEMKLLLYRNVRTIYSYSSEWGLIASNGWFLKDASGAYVTYTHSGGVDYMVDIGNPDYQNWVADWIKKYIQLYGFDGTFTDNALSVGPATSCWWGCSTVPLNPRTGIGWTDDEIVNAYIALHRRIKAVIGSKLDVANGIFNGERFFSNRFARYVKILDEAGLDGVLSEGLFHYEGYYSEDKWRKSVDLVVWVQNNFLNQTGRIYMPHSDGNIPTDSTKEQLATFVFSSFLLGVGTSANYLTIQGATLLPEIQNLFRLDLGTANGSYYLVEGTHVYARDFSRFKVLVNPTAQPFQVNLNASYVTLDGKTVTSLFVEPHKGFILQVIL